MRPLLRARARVLRGAGRCEAAVPLCELERTCVRVCARSCWRVWLCDLVCVSVSAWVSARTSTLARTCEHNDPYAHGGVHVGWRCMALVVGCMRVRGSIATSGRVCVGGGGGGCAWASSPGSDELLCTNSPGPPHPVPQESIVTLMTSLLILLAVTATTSYLFVVHLQEQGSARLAVRPPAQVGTSAAAACGRVHVGADVAANAAAHVRGAEVPARAAVCAGVLCFCEHALGAVPDPDISRRLCLPLAPLWAAVLSCLSCTRTHACTLRVRA
jgi:hypothetical protein